MPLADGDDFELSFGVSICLAEIASFSSVVDIVSKSTISLCYNAGKYL